MNIENYISDFRLENVLPQSIIPLIHLKSYKKGQIILESRSRAEAIFFIVHGEVEISNFLLNGKYMFINNLAPLEIFGDVEFLSGEKVMFDVIATMETKVIIVPFRIIDKELGNNPYFWRFIAKEGNNKLLRTNRAIILKSSYDLKTVFANYLVQNGYILKFKSLVELAEHLNVSYRNLTRIIGELKEKKIIEKNKKSIVVLRKDIILEMTLEIWDINRGLKA